LKNIGGQADRKIEHYRAILVQLQQKFLAHAAVTTGVTVLRMEDGVSRVIAQLKEVSCRASEAGAYFDLSKL
jgi:hypothetical protein